MGVDESRRERERKGGGREVDGRGLSRIRKCESRESERRVVGGGGVSTGSGFRF